jgi:hypothetical protein
MDRIDRIIMINRIKQTKESCCCFFHPVYLVNPVYILLFFDFNLFVLRVCNTRVHATRRFGCS